MSPDLNSLPPSRSTMHAPSQATPVPTMHGPFISPGSPSPRASTHSLASAAAMNAADRSRGSSTSNTTENLSSRRSEERRRRSLIALNINRNDPTTPSSGEMIPSEHHSSFTHQFSSTGPATIGNTAAIASGDPHHQRTPSLGELHQELEEEQEAQVNRMLLMIRRQQSELERLRSQPHTSTTPSRHTSQPVSATAAILDDLTPASEPPTFHLPPTATHSQQAPRLRDHGCNSASQSPALQAVAAPRPSSPSTYYCYHPEEEGDHAGPHSASPRNESAYYEAETASLTRENQLLRQRIRELERQLAQGTGNAGSDSGSVARHSSHHSSNPAVHSPLVQAMDKS